MPIGDDSTNDLIVGGDAGCSADVPTSVCVASLSFRGSDRLEFLVTSPGSERARPLDPGELIGEHSAPWEPSANGAVRAHNLFVRDRPELIGYGAFLGGREDYLIGFRLAVEGGGYR